ncbi:hypothetical protein P7H30_10205 [Streptococcus parauberis]|uniref:hypothetical protein n=1 Tax=Streptococcus parauberis TaxID=1348 RepID=UPI00288DF7C1|nr:hypothetical protein [Streptococcus parauberis]MDT2750088.1 hypothetical protein [Streptococcus parauberis]
MNIDDLYLAFQPIEASKASKTVFSEYEVLLRTTDKSSFPFERFNEIVASEGMYNIYIEWFKIELERTLLEHEEVNFQ